MTTIPLRLPARPYSEPGSSGAMLASALHLPCRLIDQDLDRKGLACAAIAHAANRRRAEIVEAHRNADVSIGCADAIRGVECDPAEAGHECFGPGMASVLLDHAVAPAKITADVAGRDADAAGGGDEDMCEVLADAAPEGEGLRRRRRGMGRIGIVVHIAVQPREHQVQ